MTIPYPQQARPAISANPQLLVLYGQQKVGKTESVTRLDDCLTIVVRTRSADHLSGRIMDVGRLCEEGVFGKFPADKDQVTRDRFMCQAYLSILEDAAKRFSAGEPVAQRIAHDDIGTIEDWVFDLALQTFLTTPAGKSKLGSELKRITDLPGQTGSPGWAWVWEEFDRMLWNIRRASPQAIILAHMRDRMVNKETGEVSDIDIDLTGKMRKILLKEASATGFMFRQRNGDLVVSFKSVVGSNVGAWCKHLVGQEIVLGRLDENKTTIYDWKTIYQ